MLFTVRLSYMNRDETCFIDPRSVKKYRRVNVMEGKYGKWSIISREVCTCKTDRFVNLDIKEDSSLCITLVIQIGRHEEWRLGTLSSLSFSLSMFWTTRM